MNDEDLKDPFISDDSSNIDATDEDDFPEDDDLDGDDDPLWEEEEE